MEQEEADYFYCYSHLYLGFIYSKLYHENDKIMKYFEMTYDLFKDCDYITVVEEMELMFRIFEYAMRKNDKKLYDKWYKILVQDKKELHGRWDYWLMTTYYRNERSKFKK